MAAQAQEGAWQASLSSTPHNHSPTLQSEARSSQQLETVLSATHRPSLSIFMRPKSEARLASTGRQPMVTSAPVARW